MSETPCPYCRSSNRPGANFCAKCGRRLQGMPSDVDDEAPTAPKGSYAVGVAKQPDLQDEPVRSIDLEYGSKTDIGLLRETNEDSVLTLAFMISNNAISQPVGLFVVADGMGGHESGEIASGMFVQSLARRAIEEWLLETISASDEPADFEAWLNGTIQGINEEIFERAHDAGYEMGTTCVAALIRGDLVHIAHVGDSRAYRINKAGIERLTIDHSLVESMVLAKQISREEARVHPQVNVIYRTIGDQPRVIVDLRRLRLLPGDALLLCSDGLSSYVSDDHIHRIVINSASPQRACDLLVEAANQAGGEDNCTAILIRPIIEV